MHKLRYDKDKLDFVEEKPSFGHYVKLVARLLVISLGLSLLYYAFFSLFINTEEEKKIITENKAIESEYEGLNSQVERLENVVSDLQERDREIYSSIFNSAPPILTTDFADSSAYYHRDSTYGKEIIAATNLRLQSVFRKVKYCDELIAEITDTLSKDLTTNPYIPSIVPVADFTSVRMGASMGRKMHPFYKKVVMHSGVDLVMPLGTDVLAAGSGVIIDVAKSKKEYGNRITIDHNNGYVTTYSHLGDIYVKRGQKIKQKDKIARVGSSGTSFAPHLHYEVLLNGRNMDPINYFFAEMTPDQTRETIRIAVNTGQSLD